MENIKLTKLGENKSFWIIVVTLIITLVPNLINNFSSNKSLSLIASNVEKTNQLLEINNAQRSNIVSFEGMKTIYRSTFSESRYSITMAVMIILKQDQLGLTSRQEYVRVKLESLALSLYKSDMNELGLFFYKGNPLSVGISAVVPTQLSDELCNYMFTKYNDSDVRENLMDIINQYFDNMNEEAIRILTSNMDKTVYGIQ